MICLKIVLISGTATFFIQQGAHGTLSAMLYIVIILFIKLTTPFYIANIKSHPEHRFLPISRRISTADISVVNLSCLFVMLRQTIFLTAEASQPYASPWVNLSPKKDRQVIFMWLRFFLRSAESKVRMTMALPLSPRCDTYLYTFCVKTQFNFWKTNK